VKRNSDNKRSPLDGRIGAHFGGRNSTRRTRIVLGLFVVIAIPMFASTLAASVSLGNGNTVEFGQGFGLVIACDEFIVTRINEEWYQTSDELDETDEVFQVSTIELTDLNVAESTVANSGCGGKVIKIQLLNNLGVPIIIGDTDLTEISVTLDFPLTATSGATAVFASPSSNDIGTLTVTISEFVHPVAAGVFRVTLESESPGP
jgi:hypothetical protein